MRFDAGIALAIREGMFIETSQFGREYEITSIVRRVIAAADVTSAAHILEDTLPAVIGSSQVSCWQEPFPRSRAVGHIVEPIGGTGYVLIARRPPMVRDFADVELETLATLARAVAPVFARLLG